MSEVIPWLARGSHSEAFTGLTGAIVLGSVSRVRYVFPLGAVWPNERVHDSIHEVDMTVEVDVDGVGTLRLYWLMQGDNEGLALSLNHEVSYRDMLTSHDVSQMEEWAGLLGRPIEEIRVSWHLPNADCPETLWSFGLSSGGHSAIVALGEVRDNVIAYQPDGLIVMFDEAAARSYQPAASSLSAWGDVAR